MTYQSNRTPTLLRPQLAEYAINPRTGFVPSADPLDRLPPAYDAWEALVPELSALIRSRQLRSMLLKMEMLDTAGLTLPPQKERALLLLSVFCNGWVWSGVEPNFRIPAQVAVPLCTVADGLGRPPIVHYASMALNNWRRIDPVFPLSADNVRMQVQFLGGVDEDWFFMGSLGVELAAAPLIEAIHATAAASLQDDDAALVTSLTHIAAGMAPLVSALERTREWCDPYVFYHRVRQFLGGWPPPGAIYEGVSEQPRKYVGGSAGQSSVIQAIDALLGVQHGESVPGRYLRLVRGYMPIGHRQFIEDIEGASCVRARALKGARSLRVAYDSALEQVALFRSRHIEIARDYIVKPSGMRDAQFGTGGTAFRDFLGAAHVTTLASRISGH